MRGGIKPDRRLALTKIEEGEVMILLRDKDWTQVEIAEVFNVSLKVIERLSGVRRRLDGKG